MAAFLDELEDGNPAAWFAVVLGFYVVLNYYRNSTTGAGGSFSPDAPADPTLDSGIDIFAPMQLSPAGAAFIKTQEGWTPVAKGDAGGQEIGWGHEIKPGENFPGAITMAQGEQLFIGDSADATAAVNNAVTAPLTQNQFDALVDFAYNEGAGALQGSTLLQRLNAKDYAGASQAFAMWDESQGQVNQSLENRRAAEQDLFNS